MNIPFATDFNVISMLYALAGIFTLYRLAQNRSSFFDRVVTAEDISLAWMVAIFLLTPFAVLAHEAGHYFMATHFEATGIELHYRGYWGYVSYQPGPTFDTRTELIVSAAGPVVSVTLGFLSLALAVLLSTRMVLKHLLAYFGMIELFHMLIGYPLIDIVSGLRGDFHSIYGLLPTPAIVVAAIIHAALVGVFVLAWSHPPTQHLLKPHRATT